MRTRVSCRAVLGWAAIALGCVPLLAQEANIRIVALFTVKPDRVNDFRAAIKDWNDLLRKAGSTRYYTTWSSMTGETQFGRVEFHIKWAEMDTPQDPKLKEYATEVFRIGSRIVQCVEKSEQWIDVIDPELSSPRPKEMPKMFRTAKILIRPGMVDEYKSLVKAELLPAMKKSGLASYGMAQTRFGGPATEFHTFMSMNGWADLDGTSPVVQAMGGQEAYRAYLNKAGKFVVRAEYNLFRYQPELSYVPAATMNVSGN